MSFEDCIKNKINGIEITPLNNDDSFIRFKNDLNSAKIYKNIIILCFKKISEDAIVQELVPDFIKWELVYTFINFQKNDQERYYKSDEYKFYKIILEKCGCQCLHYSGDLMIKIPWPRNIAHKFILKVIDVIRAIKSSFENYPYQIIRKGVN